MVLASKIARFLGVPLVGADVEVERPRALSDAKPGSLLFATTFDPALAETLSRAHGAFVLAAPEFAGHLRVAHALVPRPRLAFARVAQEFFAPKLPGGIDPSAKIAAGARLASDVFVGAFAVIGEGVSVGEGSRIEEHAVIRAGATIGRRTTIGAHTVIGAEGYGFELDEDRTPIRLPHYASVVIGDDVEIGPSCVIARGTLTDTTIGDHVKIDGLVFLAHNVRVGDRSLIIGGAQVSGSVRIGARAWLGPQSCILQKVEIGEDAMVGLGAVVLRSVAPGDVISGNPARVAGKRTD